LGMLEVGEKIWERLEVARNLEISITKQNQKTRKTFIIKTE